MAQLTCTMAETRTHRPVPRSIWIAAAIVTLSVAVITLLRHHLFLSQAYDLGFYVHDVWRLSQNEWTSSVFGFHIFADHFSPIMLLLVPFAWLGATAESLLLVQAFAVGGGVIGAYRLGAIRDGHRLGVLAALWFGSSSAIWHTIMYDFRPATLGVITLIWLIVGLEYGWKTSAIVGLAVLAASAREDVAVLAALVLLIHVAIRRERVAQLLSTAGLIASVGLGYSLGGARLFAPFDYFLWYRYADYGASPAAVLANIDYAVPTALSRLGSSNPLIAVVALTVPMLVIPVVRNYRRTWPAFLIIVANGISAHAPVASIVFQYYAAVVVFLIWGATYAFAQEPWRNRLHISGALSLALFLSVGPMLYVGYGIESRTVSGVVSSTDRRQLTDLVAMVPPAASVSAGEKLLPHVAQRRQVYPFPGPMRCGRDITFFVPTTFYPEYVLVERPELQSSGVDLVDLGYEIMASEHSAQLWMLTEQQGRNLTCPSPEEAREMQFEKVRIEARSK